MWESFNGHLDTALNFSAGLKRPDKADKAKRLRFGSPFQRRPGVSLTAGVVE